MTQAAEAHRALSPRFLARPVGWSARRVQRMRMPHGEV